MPEPKWMTVREAAAELGIDESTLYRLCRSRKIRHRRIGAGAGKITFTRADLDSYLESCVVEVGEAPGPTPGPASSLKYLRPQGSRRA